MRGSEDRPLYTFFQRLVPVLLAGLMLLPLDRSVSASTAQPVTDEVLIQSGRDLVLLTNRQRTVGDLVTLRMDPDLMAIARDRAEVMAATDTMSHTEPDGRNVFDRLTDAGLTWYGAGEIITWNNYPTGPLSVAESIRAWMASPSHREIILSGSYNYVGFGAAVSATGKHYYAGVFVKEPDKTVPWARLGSVSTRSVDAGHVRVTVRWSGGDPRLQVLTSGLRYFEVQWRAGGGEWRSWGTTTATAQTTIFARRMNYQVRVRARDNAGNWGAWRTLSINL